MYHPTTRVLTVLELLETHGPLSGPDLARRLEVSERTIRRYITMLQDLGIPIENARGRHGAYRLRPGYKVPPLMFTEDEAVALTLGLLMTRRSGGADATPATASALAKIERVLPLPLRARVQAVQDSVVLDMAQAPHIPAGTILGTLSVATQQRRTVQMRYRSWEGQATNRAFDPYGVVFHGGRWFAAGYCHLRREPRVFRVDRMVRAEMSEATFTRPAHFDTLAHVTRALATMPSTWFVDALLATTLEEARQKVPPAFATLLCRRPGVGGIHAGRHRVPHGGAPTGRIAA